MLELYERGGHPEFRAYLKEYIEFHASLHARFGRDLVLFYILLLIDLFSPHRFKSDYELLQVLVPAHARCVQFLEHYLRRHYSEAPADAVESSSSPEADAHSAVRSHFLFCIEKLNEARRLEQFMTITSSRVGLPQMLPLLAEICAGTLL